MKTHLLVLLIFALVLATIPAEAKILRGRSPPSLIERYVDYIVIGSGPAGFTAAYRLASSGFSVALFERGHDNTRDPRVRMPFFHEAVREDRPAKRYYTTRNDATIQRAIAFDQGHGLGGSTSINGGVAIVPSVRDIDSWQSDYGLQDWNYASLFNYFLRFQNNSLVAEGDNQYPVPVGTNGHFAVSSQNNTSPNSNLFLSSVVGTLGLPANHYISTSLSKRGVGYAQKSITRDTRERAAAAFLNSQVFTQLDDLRVYTDALVTKILVSARGNTQGVTVLLGSETYNFYASKEVLLAAGVIETPKLLMLSGIGPRSVLTALDIPVVVDAPHVGQNLTDHPGLYIVSLSGTQEVANPAVLLPAIEQHAYQQWLYNGTGPYGVPLVGVTAFYPSTILEPTYSPSDWDNLQVSMSGWSSALSLPAGTFTTTCFLVRSHSRGNITISSDSPYADPIVNPNYLSHPSDLQALVNCLRHLHYINTNTTASPLAQTIWARITPDLTAALAKPTRIEQDAELANMIRGLAIPGYHLGSTVAMGSALDREMRIPGVDNLRVIDISAHPFVVANNPQVSVFGVAERAVVFAKIDALPACSLALHVTPDCQKGGWKITNPNQRECAYTWQSGTTRSEFTINRSQINQTLYNAPHWAHTTTATMTVKLAKSNKITITNNAQCL